MDVNGSSAHQETVRMMQEEMTTLVTGIRVPSAVLETTLISLRELCHEQPVAFQEIVTMAHDSGFELTIATRKWATARGLLVGDQLDPLVREIIVAVVGTDFPASSPAFVGAKSLVGV